MEHDVLTSRVWNKFTQMRQLMSALESGTFPCISKYTICMIPVSRLQSSSEKMHDGVDEDAKA